LPINIRILQRAGSSFTKVVAQLVQFLSDNRADDNVIDQESVVDEEELVPTEAS